MLDKFSKNITKIYQNVKFYSFKLLDSIDSSSSIKIRILMDFKIDSGLSVSLLTKPISQKFSRCMKLSVRYTSSDRQVKLNASQSKERRKKKKVLE